MLKITYKIERKLCSYSFDTGEARGDDAAYIVWNLLRHSAKESGKKISFVCLYRETKENGQTTWAETIWSPN